MTGVLFPVDNPGVQIPAKMIRDALSALLFGATPGSRPLGAASGVARGTGTPASVTKTSVSIGPHAGVLDVEVAADAGPYIYAFDAAVNKNITAASTFVRTDIVYVYIVDATQDGSPAGTLPKVDIGYLANTTTGAQPATPTGAMLLATISYPTAASGAAPTITWVAPLLPGNDQYNGVSSGNTTVTTSGPVNLTNQLVIPAVAYPTIINVDFGALVTTSTAATDTYEISLLVNGSPLRAIRGVGTLEALPGGYQMTVAANTQTTLQLQAAKLTGTGTTTFANDGLRRWLQATVMTN